MEQLGLFNDANEASLGKVVFTVGTDLGLFGNRTDVFVVDESTVRGVSLLECDNDDVDYYNHQSADPFGD